MSAVRRVIGMVEALEAFPQELLMQKNCDLGHVARSQKSGSGTAANQCVGWNTRELGRFHLGRKQVKVQPRRTRKSSKVRGSIEESTFRNRISLKRDT